MDLSGVKRACSRAPKNTRGENPMAYFRDKDLVETCLSGDSRAFVFDWLCSPLQKKDLTGKRDLDACIEDILDDLQADMLGTAFAGRSRS